MRRTKLHLTAMIGGLSSNSTVRSMRVPLRSVAVSLALMLLVGACGTASVPTGSSPAGGPSGAATEPGTPIRGGILKVATDANPVGLDPHKSPAFASWIINEQLYSTLLGRDADGEIVPGLAESYETPDDTTYVFHLREGLKFSNGHALTAEDVAYSFMRMKDPDTASPWKSIYDRIEKIETPDDLTVTFTMTEPFGPFLSYASYGVYGAIVDQEVVEEAGDLQLTSAGAGPFMLAEYNPGQNIILEANPNYWEEGVPYLDGIEIQVIEDQSTRISAIRSGTVDFTWLFEVRIDEIIGSDPNIIVMDPERATGEEGLAFNQTKPPFNDVNVRRAVSLALDRQAIIDTVLNGKGQVGTKIPCGSVPYGYCGDGSDLPYHTRDIEEAKRLLAEAGFPDGLDTTLVVSPLYPRDVSTAEVMQTQLADAGIQVEIIQQEWGTVLQDYIDTAYDGMSMIGLVWQPDPDADVYDIYYSKSAINLGKWNDSEEVDGLLDAGRSTIDVDARAEIYLELQQLVADQAYMIFPYTVFGNTQLMSTVVQGFTPSDSGLHPGWRYSWLNR